MKVKFYTKSGENKKTEKLSDKIQTDCFDLAINEYVKYLNNSRRNLVAKVKDRSEVRGGGKKPWKQKGTGNARVGSNRSPLWRGGGITFGPTGECNYKTRINKKEIRKIKSAIISRFAEASKVSVVEKIADNAISTKKAEKLLQRIGFEGKITVILKDSKSNAYKSFKNLPYVDLLTLNKLDFSKIVASDFILFEDEAYKEMGK